VVPHGHSLHAALHVVAGHSARTCPLVEYPILKMRQYYHFEKNPPTPEAGRIAPREAPGFGIEFDPARVEKQSEVKWS
jgi:L-alanine-DL-glutamate epimerase-like enolase superfamily enzyme